MAIVSQSGAFGVSVYALLREAGVGVRCVAATGNEADLDTADFIAALAQRPGVRLILLYLEHVGDTQRMRAALETARQRGVCVVAVRAGRSADGRRSAGLHTGSAGAANDELDALFADGGCRTVADMGEMLRCVPGYLQAGDAQRAGGAAAGDHQQLRRVLRDRRRRGQPRRHAAGTTFPGQPGAAG